MFYGNHTTRKAERDLLMEQEGEEIEISPEAFQRNPEHKCIVCEEGTGRYYEHTPDSFIQMLSELDGNINYDYTKSDYYKEYAYKGADVTSRINRLPKLLADIKENGIQEPVHCEITGERLDGSYRTKIALYLGIDKVKAIRHKFHWSQIDDDFIERKIKARWLSSGKEYYQFQYPNGMWNMPEGGEVYKENADRWEEILPYIKGKTVLDCGCNEGFIDIQLARKGYKVVGIDLNYTHNAWLNKLIFEYCDKKDLPVEFHEELIQKTRRKGDTVLMLNVLYHIPKEEQKAVLEKFRGKRIIFQCNLRKERERENYYTSHPDDLKALLKEMNMPIFKEIIWRDKPIIIV